MCDNSHNLDCPFWAVSLINLLLYYSVLGITLETLTVGAGFQLPSPDFSLFGQGPFLHFIGAQQPRRRFSGIYCILYCIELQFYWLF